MDKIGDIERLKEHQNILLEGFDPVSTGGFTQLPNCVLNDPHLSPGGKVVYAKLLSYAWYNTRLGKLWPASVWYGRGGEN
jgi:hypothetical protein